MMLFPYLLTITIEHLPLLRSVRAEAYKVVQNRWGLAPGSLRMWIHYQPSYYHFHVHIANASYEAPGFGMAVGQAHLLEDVISLVSIFLLFQFFFFEAYMR